MNRKTLPFLTAVVLLCAAPLLAGPLASDPTAFIDNGTPPFQWTGTTSFSNTSGLAGNLDWVVYGPGTFPAGFGGYTPTTGEYVYAYQVIEHGSISLSQVAVKLVGPADNIGTFSGNLVIGDPSTNVNGDPTMDAFISPLLSTGGSANWLFDGVLPGQTSIGLAYSSPNAPMFLRGTTIDHGTVASVIPLPSPIGNIPEPGTLTLAICGLSAFGWHWLRRRGRKSSRETSGIHTFGHLRMPTDQKKHAS